MQTVFIMHNDENNINIKTILAARSFIKPYWFQLVWPIYTMVIMEIEHQIFKIWILFFT